MMDIETIADHDRSSVLHPFTQLKDFATGKIGDPTIVTGGKGIRIEDATGHRCIDGFAGLYCVNIGYGRAEVAEAIARQAYKLAYYHTYAAHSSIGMPFTLTSSSGGGFPSSCARALRWGQSTTRCFR